MSALPAQVRRHAMHLLADCPRCHGLPYEQDEPSLCLTCVDQIVDIALEDAAEDAARELAEDREYWGCR